MQLTLTLRVADVSAAVGWYEAVFGKPPIYVGVDRSLSGKIETIACFRLAGVKVWLSKRSCSTAPATDGAESGATITFMTRDPCAHIRARLIERGALVRRDETKPDFPADEHGVRQGRDAEFFYIYDPDGNRFEFCRVFSRGTEVTYPSQ